MPALAPVMTILRSDIDAPRIVLCLSFHAEAQRTTEDAENCLPGRDARTGALFLSIHDPKWS
jgi:hypothetical protein